MKINFYPKLLIAFTLFISHKGVCQNSSLKYIPQFAPQSPNVASLGKYGEYSVNLFTGTPDISIPLYEVKSGSLSVPITLSYNAGGFRFTDKAGFVGLGWSLSSGGVVSRSMQGLADESYQYLSKTILANRDECNADDRDYLVNLEKGVYDGQPDIFSYSFPGKGGKFVLGQNGQDPFTFPYEPIKIGYNLTTNKFQDFSIRDDNGTFYKFAPGEHTFNDNGGSSTNLQTAWYLEEMQSANADDKISFTYQSGGQVRSYEKVSQLALHDYIQTGLYFSPSQSKTELNTSSVVNSLIPQTINFPNGKVVFYTSTYNIDQIRLDSIDVFEVKGTQELLIKSINFSYSFFQDSYTNLDISLKLNGIDITDKNRTAIQKYNFQYWTNTLSRNYPYAVDYWGFYNGETGNGDLFPSRTVDFYSSGSGGNTPLTFGTANRNSSPIFAKEGVLKRIAFPTGGYSEFDYEGNRYFNHQTQLAENAGGGRITSIKSYDGINSNPSSVKTYKYGQNESGLGEINNLISRRFFNTTQTVTLDGLSKDDKDVKRVRSYTASPILASSGFDNSPVVYPFVTEYNGGVTSNSGKTYIQFSHDGDLEVDLGSQNGVLYKDYYFWKRGHIINKTIYDASNNIVSSTNNTYTILQETSRLVGAKAFMHRYSEGGIYKICAAQGGQVDEYTYRAYTLKTGAVRLSKSIETIYPGNFQTIKNYTYHPTELLAIEEKETTSTGEEIIISNKYPVDLKASSTVAAQMHSRNMLTPLITTQKVNGTSLTYILHNAYRSEPNGRSVEPSSNIVLSEVKEAANGNTLETRLKYDQYDQSGNVLQFSVSDNIANSYIWGYNNSLAIAEVKNALSKDVFHTSFEDSEGNSSNGDSKAGLKSRTGGYQKYLGNLSNGSYMLSYWQKNGAIWEYQSAPINIGSSDYTINLSGQIDEVRFHPSNAQMTTYTHNPLIGITSACDPNNKTTYFEYDSFNRLKLVKDDKGNILKQNQYNYKQ